MVGRDVARSLKDGSIHTLTVPLGPSYVEFDGTPVPIDRRGITGRLAVDGRGVRYATVIGWDGGSVLVRDDGHLTPMNEGGRFWTAIRPLPVGVEVYAQGGPENGGESCTIHVYNEAGQQVRSFSAKYGSLGIIQITGANSIKSTVEHVTTIAGRTMYYVMTVDGWSVGQLEYVPPGGAEQWGTLGLVSPDGQYFYANVAPPWNGYTNMPTHLAVDGSGHPYAAINDPTDQWLAPDPGAIVWSPIDPSRGTLEDAIARNRLTIAPVNPSAGGAGGALDLFPIVVVAGVAGAIYLLHRK